MFDTQKFLAALDAMYGAGRTREAEDYLKQGLKEAEESGDSGALLAVLNEIMGYYRTLGRHGESGKYAGQAVALAERMGLSGTLQYGTLLLNAATAARAAGHYEDAERMYVQVEAIYRGQLWQPDYRMASLHNNRSILYSETGRLKEAGEELERAMEVISRLDDSEVEIAITHTNLGNLFLRMGRLEDGIDHLRQAIDIYERQPGPKNSHYPSALSGLGEAFYRKGQLAESVAAYEKAMAGLEAHFGRNEAWRITEKNWRLVRELSERERLMKERNLRGLELSRAYYEEYGKPLLEKNYPEYAGRIAAGLVGEGSECLGFDDVYSMDHDYGPGFCLWLTKEDYEAIGEKLQADYDALPKEFMGFPARNTTAQAGRRVGVFETGAFYKRLTGYEDAPATERQWRDLPQEALQTATSGEIFADPLGEFTGRRARFLAYPESVRLKKLALALGKMGQAGQYNYGRAIKRGDTGAAYFSLSEFLEAAAEAAYLLNGIYMPFYKWRMRGMESFTCLTELRARMEELMRCGFADETVDEKIEAICGLFVQELNRQGLSRSGEQFLECQKGEVWKMAEEKDKQGQEKPVQGEQKKESKLEREKVDESLAEEITALEWRQFQKVKNEGGRASCQDDRRTFEIMRKSQFMAWNRESAESYLEDLKQAERDGWNLLTEKYARMMESTAPEQYRQLAGRLPGRREERLQKQEELIRQIVDWEADFQRRYPNLAGRGRRLRTSEDTPFETSFETYARGEMGTYSDRTIECFGRWIGCLKEEGENLSDRIMGTMVKCYGYGSVEEAEKVFKNRK